MQLNDISKQLDSGLEARILLKHITGLNDADLIVGDDIQLTDTQQTQLDDFIQQRSDGRPISKIIGTKEFYGRDFIVNDDVLDPRPDSEILIDVVLKYTAQDDDSLKILDLGTGSGCLILTLLAEIPNAIGVATDMSDKALSIARQNAGKLCVQERIQFIKSDWLDNVAGTYDIIVTNPPYINSDIIPTLEKTVSEYDPILALDGGDDGLNPYKVILPQVKKHLTTGGMVAMEHGYDQCGRIKRLIENAGLTDIQDHQDLGGHDRVLTAIHK